MFALREKRDHKSKDPFYSKVKTNQFARIPLA